MFNFTDTRKSIKDITSMFEEGSLIVDETYQRRSVWSEKDKIRLIETVLLKLVIPVLFFWKAETDPDTGKSITHIVDGQQRIKAICSFVNNEFKLKRQYLLDKNAADKYGDKFFRDLDSEDKKDIWNYMLMVIDIDRAASRNDIITMFNRLNLTDYNLNDQEKRNSKSGEFASLARELSDDPIWEQKHLFTTSDIKRMKDAVVHAHWIQAEDECGEGTNVYKCSACREIQFLKFGTPQWNEWNYCPNCGADMKEEKQDG